MDWTPERVTMLQQLWGNGFSASEIADKLGSTTRNAVIGKAHRLHLPARPSPVKLKPNKPMVVMSDRMCRWPQGHPNEPGFKFCGEAAEPGRPYCTTHCNQAYRKKDESAAA